MAKKKKVAKKQAAVSASKKENVNEDVFAKAEAFDKIAKKSAEVDVLESKYGKAKDASLAAKKTFDEAEKELRQLIRENRGDTMPLFNEEPTSGVPTAAKK